MAKLDRSKPFSTVRGLPGVGYEQDEKIFDFHGNEIVKVVESAVPQPVRIQEVVVKMDKVNPIEEVQPAMEESWKTSENEPEVEGIVTTEPSVEGDLFKCPQCDFVGKNIMSLRAHQRHWGH